MYKNTKFYRSALDAPYSRSPLKKTLSINDLIVAKNEKQIVEGVVKDIRRYGAIISFGYYHGLLHISQISNSYVRNVEDHLSLKDIVKVKVLKIEKIKKEKTDTIYRISLSMKQVGL